MEATGNTKLPLKPKLGYTPTKGTLGNCLRNTCPPDRNLLSLDACLVSLKAEDTHWDRKACVEAKEVAVARHPSDGENLKTSKFTLEGLYP
jgi:hypothetical protein